MGSQEQTKGGNHVSNISSSRIPRSLSRCPSIVRRHGRRRTDCAWRVPGYDRRLQRLHTPGYFFGKPDMSRFLGGSDVGFEIPGLGVFPGRNITPDKETGIGSWTPEQIVVAIQTGQRPDGRTLAPIMPWHAFAHLTADDAMAIAAFLQSVKPVSNQIPDPFKPGDTVSTFLMRIIPPGGTAAAAPK